MRPRRRFELLVDAHETAAALVARLSAAGDMKLCADAEQLRLWIRVALDAVEDELDQEAAQ